MAFRNQLVMVGKRILFTYKLDKFVLYTKDRLTIFYHSWVYFLYHECLVVWNTCITNRVHVLFRAIQYLLVCSYNSSLRLFYFTKVMKCNSWTSTIGHSTQFPSLTCIYNHHTCMPFRCNSIIKKFKTENIFENQFILVLKANMTYILKSKI